MKRLFRKSFTIPNFPNFGKEQSHKKKEEVIGGNSPSKKEVIGRNSPSKKRSYWEEQSQKKREEVIGRNSPSKKKREEVILSLFQSVLSPFLKFFGGTVPPNNLFTFFGGTVPPNHLFTFSLVCPD